MNDDKVNDYVIYGDAVKALLSLPDESIHLTFTSPPYYNAREYSQYDSYADYLNILKNIFIQVYRLTKEGRFLVVNTSPVLVPRIDRQHQSKRLAIPFDLNTIITDIGFDFIDDIIWKKPEASVKNRNGQFLQNRKPLAYKPNAVTEYVMVYRKHTDKLIDWNINGYDDKTIEESKIEGDFESTNVWKITPAKNKHHPAVFPEDLCQKIIRYYSFKGDVVLDPFAGSGTVGRVASQYDRHYILVEKEQKYIDYIMKSLPQSILKNN